MNIRKRKKFGLDIDGTVTHPATFIPYVNQHFNKNITLDDITEYELSTHLQVTPEEFWDWLRAHESTIYATASLAEYVESIIHSWKQQHEMIYISARGDHLLDVTIEWFQTKDIPYHHIELIGKHDKVETIQNHELDIYFEDKHDNACDIAEACQIPVILLDTPYNRKPIPPNVYRAKNWKEANQWVTNWLNEQKT